MSTAYFTLIYDGSALTDGQMDVRELAPSLQGISDLFEESNRNLNNGEATVSVQGGFEKGSLIIGLVATQTIVGHLAENIVLVTSLVTLLFGSRGVLDFLKWLKGATPTPAVKMADGNIQVNFEDSRNITVTNNVYQLSENPTARQAVGRVVAPLRNEGIESLKVTSKKEVLLEVGKEDVPALTDLGLDENILSDTETEAFLEVVAPSFKLGNKWRLSNGSATSSYSIEDSEFLTKVDQGTERFAKGDLLKVKMRAITGLTKRGDIKADQIIVKVLEHRRKELPTLGPSEEISPLGGKRKIRLK